MTPVSFLQTQLILTNTTYSYKHNLFLQTQLILTNTTFNAK
jgi:hypothetical protein